MIKDFVDSKNYIKKIAIIKNIFMIIFYNLQKVFKTV